MVDGSDTVILLLGLLSIIQAVTGTWLLHGGETGNATITFSSLALTVSALLLYTSSREG